MATLSLAMIVRDEAPLLGRALAGIKPACDQIVVVDTGSVDNTVQVAQSAGAQVHHLAWIDDFSAARNAAFSHCQSDWILWLDADDIVQPATLQAILQLKSTLMDQPHFDALLCPYHISFHPDGQVNEKYDRERLVRRAAGPVWQDPVHETINVSGMRCTRQPQVIIEHHPDPARSPSKKGRNLRIYRARLDLATAHPHSLFQYACELQWNDLPAEAAQMFGAFLSKVVGVADDNGDQYLAQIKRADCLAQGGDLLEAIAGCLAAIALDGRRAEAPCLAGELLLARGHLQRALPFLTTATVIALPQHTPKLVFPWFYNERPKKALRQCIKQLNPPEHDDLWSLALQLI